MWLQKAQPLPNLASWSIFSPFPCHAMEFPNCFVKALFGKFPLKMMQKLCADMYPVSPLPCDAGAPSEFHWLLNLAAAPRPPPSSPFSCKWRLPNTGGEDTGWVVKVCRSGSCSISAYLLCFHVTSPPTSRTSVTTIEEQQPTLESGGVGLQQQVA